jgi:hypothetical protein
VAGQAATAGKAGMADGYRKLSKQRLLEPAPFASHARIMGREREREREREKNNSRNHCVAGDLCFFLVALHVRKYFVFEVIG